MNNNDNTQENMKQRGGGSDETGGLLYQMKQRGLPDQMNYRRGGCRVRFSLMTCPASQTTTTSEYNSHSRLAVVKVHRCSCGGGGPRQHCLSLAAKIVWKYSVKRGG